MIKYDNDGWSISGQIVAYTCQLLLSKDVQF